jgi:hypothetical protein
MLDVVVRYTLLGIYSGLFDNGFPKLFEALDIPLTCLQVFSMSVSIVVINDTFILGLAVKFIAALELLKFLICLIFRVQYTLSFNSVAALCLAIFLLGLPSATGFFKCWYGYHIISPPREPILSHSLENDSTFHMDSYNENQGPLSLAYRQQKEQREQNHPQVSDDRLFCSDGDHLVQQVSSWIT